MAILPDLKLLVNYHMITGNNFGPFMGWNEQGGHLSKKKLLLILCNVTLIITLLTFSVLNINRIAKLILTF